MRSRVVTIRTYTTLMGFETLPERFDYLQLGGQIGEATFGFERWINQKFYTSREWRLTRQHVIARDYGLDLGHPDFPVRGQILVHHLNPLTKADILESTENLMDPEFLISVAHRTHNAIHYGDANLLPQPFVERTPGDTDSWTRM